MTPREIAALLYLSLVALVTLGPLLKGPRR